MNVAFQWRQCTACLDWYREGIEWFASRETLAWRVGKSGCGLRRSLEQRYTSLLATRSVIEKTGIQIPFTAAVASIFSRASWIAADVRSRCCETGGLFAIYQHAADERDAIGKLADRRFSVGEFAARIDSLDEQGLDLAARRSLPSGERAGPVGLVVRRS